MRSQFGAPALQRRFYRRAPTPLKFPIARTQALNEPRGRATYANLTPVEGYGEDGIADVAASRRVRRARPSIRDPALADVPAPSMDLVAGPPSETRSGRETGLLSATSFRIPRTSAATASSDRDSRFVAQQAIKWSHNVLL